MYMDHKNLPLIREKIASIRSALFSNAGGGALKYNTCIISALKVDEHGCVWFLINRNGWRGFNDDLHFPATLSFYRKGINHSLSISGEAEIISNEDIIRYTLTALEEEQHLAIPELLLVKLSIENAVIFNWADTGRKMPVLEKLYSLFRKLPYFNTAEPFAYKAI